MFRTIVLTIFILSFLSACVEEEKAIEGIKPARVEQTSEGIVIEKIVSDTSSYTGREVTVSGTVTAGLAFEFVNEQPYLLKDDTGEIWVITTGTMPEDGSRITVRGTVTSPYQIKGRSYETALIEIERKQ